MSIADDPVIPDWEVLIRRVIINKNSAGIESDGTLRLTTAGFKIDDDGVSLYRSQILQVMGYGPSAVAGDRAGAVPVALMVGHVRSAGVGVRPDPIPVPEEVVDPAHALLTFEPSLSRQRRKQLLREALVHGFVLSRALVVSGDPAEPVLVVSDRTRTASVWKRMRRRASRLFRAGNHV